MTGGGLALAGLIAGYVSVLIVLIAVALLVPALIHARAQARRSACMSYQRQAVMGIIVYSDDHDGTCPPGLDVLKEYGVDGALLRCPGRGNAAGSEADDQGGGLTCDYLYFGQGLQLMRVPEPGRTVLLCDRAGNHKKGIIAAFADGHVEWSDAASIRDALEQSGWVLPPGVEPPEE
jgi:prepilin-type processing-associated H-X9-DG protein